MRIKAFFILIFLSFNVYSYDKLSDVKTIHHWGVDHYNYENIRKFSNGLKLYIEANNSSSSANELSFLPLLSFLVDTEYKINFSKIREEDKGFSVIRERNNMLVDLLMKKQLLKAINVSIEKDHFVFTEVLLEFLKINFDKEIQYVNINFEPYLETKKENYEYFEKIPHVTQYYVHYLIKNDYFLEAYYLLSHFSIKNNEYKAVIDYLNYLGCPNEAYSWSVKNDMSNYSLKFINPIKKGFPSLSTKEDYPNTFYITNRSLVLNNKDIVIGDKCVLKNFQKKSYKERELELINE